jgi:adenosylcobinamide-phosphate guanylyltransferase
MGVVGLVMAGGRGSRFNISEEKPLVKLAGIPIINYVLKALKEAKSVDDVIVAVSNNTPKTTKILSRLPVSIVKTPGKEYVYDMAYAIRKLALKTVLVIGSDLPLITGEIIDLVVEKYKISGKSALNVVIPLKTRNKLGLSGAYAFALNGKQVVPAGINIIDGNKIDNKELDEEIFLLDKKEVALNINTIADFEIARALISKSARKNIGSHNDSYYHFSNNRNISGKYS